MSDKVYWQTVKFSSLRVEEWNEEYTVFQPDSGKTHFLNQMGIDIILTLNQSAASIDEVCNILTKRFQLSSGQDFTLSLNKTFHRFEELGLIEKIK